MKAYKHLIRYSLKAGHVISVWDGEEWQVKRSSSFKAICEAVESVEEAQLRIRRADTEGKEMGWALVSAFGLEDDETVCDHTVNEFMDAWSNSYQVSLV
jgi:hypothetical protein